MSKFKRIDHIFENIGSSKYMVLGLIILFAVILRLAVFSGITGKDDMIYIYPIYKFSIGDFEPGHSHWSLRLGLILPISLLVRIFGFNEFALVLFPLLCSVANIFLIYAFAKLLFNEKIALHAAFLLSFFPLEVFFATMVFVDLPIALFMGLVVFYFLKGEMQNKARYYLLSGFCIGFAYLSRLTGLYILLFFIMYVIIERKLRLRYSLIIVGLLSIVFLEWGYYYRATGDPVHRFSVILGERRERRQRPRSQKTTTKQVNPDESFFKGKSSRGLRVLRGNNWFIEPIFTFTTNQEFGFFYYFIFPITIYLILKKDKKTKILLIWMIPVALYILYGTTSPFRFSSLRRWPRYLDPITLPALLILAYFLHEKKHWLWNKFSFLTTSFLLVTSLICTFGFNDGPTDGYIVKEIAMFREQNSQKSILVYWKMYQHLAPFLKYQKNLNINLYGFPEDPSKESLYEGVGAADPDNVTDSYIVVPLYDYGVNPQKNNPEWELVHSIVRPEKFYCPVLKRVAFIPHGVKEKLCPNEICEIYYIP